jgi:hypothetical protein
MDIRNKIIRPSVFILCCILMLCTFLSACGDLRTESDGVIAPETEGSESYDFRFFFGSAEDPVMLSELVRTYEMETGIKVEAVFTEPDNDDERALWRSLNANDPPVGYCVSANANTDNIEADGFVATLSALGMTGDTSYIPYMYRGKGFAVDTRVIAELVGASLADALLEDLRSCSFGEWANFVAQLSAYINYSVAAEFMLNGRLYVFAQEKGELSGELNGVFAVQGAEPSVYGNTLFEVALSTTDLAAWESARSLATPEAITVLSPGLNAYIACLDNITSNASGRFAPAIRGKDFVKKEYYSAENAMRIFSEGKALFILADSNDYADFAAIDAAKAGHLALIPVKMPYEENGLPATVSADPADTTGSDAATSADIAGADAATSENIDGIGATTSADASPANAAIPARVTHYLCVNGNESPEGQQAAADFIVWLTNAKPGLDNSLQNEARHYFDSGQYLPFSIKSESLAAYETALFEKSKLTPWLSDNRWDDALRQTLLEYMFNYWHEG